MEAGYAGYLSDVIEGDFLGEMGFDEPEGFVDGIHNLLLIYYNGGDCGWDLIEFAMWQTSDKQTKPRRGRGAAIQ